MEKSHRWHHRLLCPRRERPSGYSAAERNNEFSPSDANCQ
jgi:hypothetical protein